MKFKTFIFLLLVFVMSAMLPDIAYAEEGPFQLGTPQNLTAELKYDSDGIPYFELKLDVPQSVIEINEKIINEEFEDYDCSEIEIQFDFKYGDFDWNEGDSMYWNTSSYLVGYLSEGSYNYYPWQEQGEYGELKIEEEVYQFRAYFFTDWGYKGDWIDNRVTSDFSNIVTIGNPAYYKGASSWAEAELDKALGYGFITERIRDDMSAKITREEFAEVAVKLYEKYNGAEAKYSDMSVFTDTRNPEIFKAYELKIVNGVGNNKFAPNDPINREQMAAMLYRLVQAIAPGTDFSTEGAPTFSDEKDISGWALENVKFMSKNGFINGIGNNQFGPKLTCSREQAVAVAVRVYEKYAVSK